LAFLCCTNFDIILPPDSNQPPFVKETTPLEGEKGGEISFVFVEAEVIFLGKKPGSEKKSLANGVFSMNDLCRW